MKKFVLGVLSVFFTLHTFGSSGDSLQISLLTVLPRSNEVYTIYGHTAIRAHNPSEKLDLVFNYGSFDWSEPNFLYRFIKGETDYYLGVHSFDEFEYIYTMGNYTVIEQVLNLSPEEKTEILQMLFYNALPENRRYRYDFLFDNCTTRPRDIIERFTNSRIVYEEQKNPTTFRTLIHECTKPYPWMTFGIDLVIGSGADSLISLRQEMFLPEKLMNALETAYIENDSIRRPMVSSTQIIIQSIEEDNHSGNLWFSPMVAGICLLAISLILGICGMIYKRRFRLFFALLFLAAGITGCIIWFVAFFSIHPCTYPNWNVFFFHPLYFIALVGYLLPKTYRFITWYHWINFVLLSSFLITWPFIPQEMNSANIPFVLCLWIGLGLPIILRRSHRLRRTKGRR
ncbi:MAG: DUF4105 domain-containing protein [Dysgonamonadaceae bacterium]|jgi:hypothetical protein|nr:DUF4105 domain-containing protein [Dysgonamonadaceae bacterium]